MQQKMIKRITMMRKMMTMMMIRTIVAVLRPLSSLILAPTSEEGKGKQSCHF